MFYPILVCTPKQYKKIEIALIVSVYLILASDSTQLTVTVSICHHVKACPQWRPLIEADDVYSDFSLLSRIPC